MICEQAKGASMELRILAGGIRICRNGLVKRTDTYFWTLDCGMTLYCNVFVLIC